LTNGEHSFIRDEVNFAGRRKLSASISADMKNRADEIALSYNNIAK